MYVLSGTCPAYAARLDETATAVHTLLGSIEGSPGIHTPSFCIVRIGTAKFSQPADSQSHIHFLREIDFLERHTSRIQTSFAPATARSAGAVEHLKATAADLVSLIKAAAKEYAANAKKPPSLLEQFFESSILSPVSPAPTRPIRRILAKPLIDTVNGNPPEYVLYLQRLATGQAHLSEDVSAFLECYFEEQCMAAASTFDLNYFELQTDAAKRYIESLAYARIEGATRAELALWFFPWAAATKEASAATKIGRFPTVFARAAEAETAAARTSRLSKLATETPRFTPASAKPAASLAKLSDLLDPLKIGTLTTDRALNKRLRKLLYWLYQEECAGHDPSEALWRAMKEAGADKPVRGKRCTLSPKLDHKQIMHEYNYLKSKGLLTPKNLERMHHGEAICDNNAVELQINHIVPKKLAPELENSWSNLEHMPEDTNKTLGKTLTPQGRAKLEQYVNERLISRDRADEIIAQAKTQPVGSP